MVKIFREASSKGNGLRRMYILFQIHFPYRLLQNFKYNCAKNYVFFAYVFYIVMYTC